MLHLFVADSEIRKKTSHPQFRETLSIAMLRFKELFVVDSNLFID